MPIREWNNIRQIVHPCPGGYILFLPDALHPTHQLLNLELQIYCNMNRYKTQCQWCPKLYALAVALSNHLTKVHSTETSQNIDKPCSSKCQFYDLSSPEPLESVLNLELVTGTFLQNYDPPNHKYESEGSEREMLDISKKSDSNDKHMQHDLAKSQPGLEQGVGISTRKHVFAQ